MAGDTSCRQGHRGDVGGGLQRLVVGIDDDEGGVRHTILGIGDHVRALVGDLADVGTVGDALAGDLATQIGDGDLAGQLGGASSVADVNRLGLGVAPAGTGVLGAVHAVGLVGVHQIGVLLTGRRAGDVTVVTRSREQLVAVLVGLEGRVRAGRLPVDVLTVDVLSGEVGLDVVLRHLGRLREGVGIVLLVPLREILDGLRGVVVQLLLASGLRDVGVIGGVVERHVREGWVGLVEGDVDESTVLEGIRLLDERNVVAQPQISGVEATGVVLRRGAQRLGVVRLAVGVEETRKVVALTGGVVGVRAVVRGDPAEGRHLVRGLGQIGEKSVGRVVGVGNVLGVRRNATVGRPGQGVLASAVIANDGVEPREGEVFGDVLVVRLSAGEGGDALGLVLLGRLHGLGVLVRGVLQGAGGASQAVLASGVVAQVLGVSLPRDAGGIELVEEGGDVLGVGATVLAVGCVRTGQRENLTVVVVAPELLAGVTVDDRRVRAETGVGDVAVGLEVHLGGLSGDHRGVVVLRVVAGAEVVGEQSALLRQLLPQVGVLVEPGEGGVVGLVLQDDEPDVLDLAAGNVRRGDGGVFLGAAGCARCGLVVGLGMACDRRDEPEGSHAGSN